MTEVVSRGHAPGELTLGGPELDAATLASAVERAAIEPAALRATRHWTQAYRYLLVAVDTAAVAAAILVGYWLRFSSLSPTNDYFLYCTVLGVGWLLALLSSGGYDVRHLATGPAEAKAVLRGAALAASVIAVFCYATRTEIARGFMLEVIPVGVLLLFVGRAIARRFVLRKRAQQRWTHRILAVGTAESVQHLVDVTTRATGAGLRVVGACVEDAEVGAEIAHGVPVLGGIFSAAQIAEHNDVDVVAVTGSGLGPTSVRELGWALEGTGRGLVLAPSLTEIAGPRVRVSPVEGLPLVWVEQPSLGRFRRAAKRALDLVGASVLLLLGLPVLLAAAAAVKLESRGPVFFRQRRLGANGAEFDILKLRSMQHGAEGRRAEILELNESDGAGVLFKIRKDPRVTRVGRLLRQFSIDELPQLVHVITGKMSLVGPRPLAVEDSIYTGHARRRLLVRPGMTGLWQVSGRSDMSWDDAVRLDLYYVENWSIGFDLGILARTVLAVLRRNGAY